MLEAGEQRMRMRIEIVLDLDDRGHRVAHLAEKFQAHGADAAACCVQDEARRGDDAVAAFLLDAGQAGQELVGDILAQPGLAETRAGNFENLRFAFGRPAVARVALDGKPRDRHIVDLAEVVIEALDVHPFGRPASTMRQVARLSSAVPHSTAFLPPAFMATLPPMQEASAEVGSHANTRPARSAASIARRVTTPAPQRTVGTGSATPGRRSICTSLTASSFSVLMTAECLVSGIAPPV